MLPAGDAALRYVGSAPEWRNGRRSRLKPGGREAWGFESLLRYQR